LQDRDDPRAEAYRALGRLRRNPACWPACETRPFVLWGWLARSQTDIAAEEILPDDWYALIARDDGNTTLAAERRTRREAEEDAVVAFAELPAERRAELLAADPLDGRPAKAPNARRKR
jgi:hypothetical protein